MMKTAPCQVKSAIMQAVFAGLKQVAIGKQKTWFENIFRWHQNNFYAHATKAAQTQVSEKKTFATDTKPLNRMNATQTSDAEPRRTMGQNQVILRHQKFTFPHARE